MGVFVLAEDEGFEPPQTESESGVLPLHKSSICGTVFIIRNYFKKSSTFFKILKLSQTGWITVKLWGPMYSVSPTPSAWPMV